MINRVWYKFLHSSMRRGIPNVISLSETELKIRNLLVDYCNHYNASHQDKPLTLRITGGWVRDKLLGYDSHDIDIAVNHLSGEEFVHNFQKYLKTKDPQFSVNHVHTIKMNPEKSKHLETCTTKLYGIDLDFINLRSEEYAHDSRVPTIEFGTLLQDALRRDATLNALFYNLNEEKIEDFTERGMNDLDNGILRTPLPPIKTFLDDPLRILRLIRFASKFNFAIEPETLDAMREKHNQQALLTKISKERIEIELRKILTSHNPSYGLQLINYCDLSKSIFFVEELKKEFDVYQLELALSKIPHQINVASTIYLTFEQLILNSKIKSVFKKFVVDSDMRFNFWLSVILHPYSIVTTKSKDIYNQYLRLGLMAKKSDITKISAIAMTSNKTLKRYFSNPDSVKRSDLGIYLRRFPEYIDLNLIVQCYLECVDAIRVETPVEIPVPNHSVQCTSDQVKTIQGVIHKYESLYSTIDSLDLSQVHLMKPLLDGNQLVKYLQRKPGPWMKPAMDNVLVWQLDHPQGTKEECIEFIKSNTVE